MSPRLPFAHAFRAPRHSFWIMSRYARSAASVGPWQLCSRRSRAQPHAAADATRGRSGWMNSQSTAPQRPAAAMTRSAVVQFAVSPTRNAVNTAARARSRRCPSSWSSLRPSRYTASPSPAWRTRPTPGVRRSFFDSHAPREPERSRPNTEGQRDDKARRCGRSLRRRPPRRRRPGRRAADNVPHPTSSPRRIRQRSSLR